MSPIHAYAARTPKAPLQLFEFEASELGTDQVEIKITHCGICHSDLSMLDNDWGMSQFRLVRGHEAVGTVLALGENAKGLKVGQRVGVGWTAYSCLSCRECLSGHHNLCATSQGTIVGRHGGFPDRLRAQWTWVRRIPDALDLAKAGPLLCGGVTVFNPFLAYDISPTARVGSSASADWVTWLFNLPTNGVAKFMLSRPVTAKKRRRAGSEPTWFTKRDGALKKIAGSLDLIISTINAPLDAPGLLEALAPMGRLHVVGAVLEPLSVPAFGMIMGQKSISGSPVGSPTAIDRMLEFSARDSIAPVVETFPMSKVNDALEHLRSGKTRYRIDLNADF